MRSMGAWFAAFALLAPAATAQGASVKDQLLTCANDARATAGLPALQRHVALGRAAQLHATAMRNQGFFGHRDKRGRSYRQRVRVADKAGRFRGDMGENLGRSFPRVSQICSAWMGSAVHRGNILNPKFTHVGAGYAKGGKLRRYYVLVFAQD